MPSTCFNIYSTDFVQRLSCVKSHLVYDSETQSMKEEHGVKLDKPQTIQRRSGFTPTDRKCRTQKIVGTGISKPDDKESHTYMTW